MLALVAIVAGLVLGLLSGGNVSSLRDLHFRAAGPALLIFVVQSLVRGSLLPVLDDLAIPLWGACSVALLLVLLRETSSPGLGIAALGVASNSLVILLNGGMPVLPSPATEVAAAVAVAGSRGFYQLADERTQMLVLGDVLPAGSGIASLGDVLLAVGVCVFIASHMRLVTGSTPDGRA